MKPSTGTKLILGSFLCFALTGFGNRFTQAQSDPDVHVVPRISSVPPAGGSTAGRQGLLTRLKVNVDVVLVPVRVADPMNHSVRNLAKEDFALFEDDQPQAIQYFSEDAGPASIALLIDVSRSMTDKIEMERAAITEFLRNADPQDEYFGIAFSDRPRLLMAGASESIDDLEAKLTTIEPGHTTAMLDAIYLAESQLRAARFKRKAIVIISDGGDNHSRYTMREIKNVVRESDVEIYAIGLFETFFFNTLEERLGKKWLEGITNLTGGRTLTVNSRAKLPEAAGEISRAIRYEYVLGYRPSKGPSSRWRKLRVQVNSQTRGSRLRPYYKNGYISGEN
jgi:Ca-activated chloride channel homolog